MRGIETPANLTAPADQASLALASSALELPLLLLSAALDDPQTGLALFDSQLGIIHLTEQIPHVLGLKPEEHVSDLTILQLVGRASLELGSIRKAKDQITHFVEGNAMPPLVLISKDQTQQVRMKLRKLEHDQFVATFETLPLDEESRVRIEELSRDTLTGLYSRSYFEKALTEALNQKAAGPIAVLVMDLNRFKVVNDTLGHIAGDIVLRRAAERLMSVVRGTDIVARLGGDEFAILVQPAPSINEPETIANRILEVVGKTYLIDGQLVNVGISIGIVRSPDHGRDVPTLLRCADLALYQAKTARRPCFQFYQDAMAHEAQRRRTFELELRRAIVLRQLELHYQPQLDTVKNRLVGFEALVRWRHPQRGLVPPGEFLPAAEQIGIIKQLGEWVLRTACRDAKNWPDDIVIAVNVSPLQFESGNFAETVRRALHETQLPGRRLEVEITEGIMLSTDRLVLERLHDLRSMDVRIAMDDFGTGYASLSQLARFPFDKIKIDRSLAGSDGENPKHRAIVRAITALGQSLGIATLAEGVETAEQLERLQSDGCMSVQGYYFGRPTPLSQVSGVIERLWRPL